MRFGMLLLVLIALLSTVGTLVLQNQPLEYYHEFYGSWANLVLKLGLDDIFHQPYYEVLFLLLCLNLMGCSLLRAGRLPKLVDTLFHQAKANGRPCTLREQDFRRTMQEAHFRPLHRQDSDFFIKHQLGVFGSFITHLGILFLVLAAACTFTLVEVEDRDVMIGESMELENGGKIRVESFTMEDEQGNLEYMSILSLLDENGLVLETKPTLVNHPAHFGPYTIYQQRYTSMGAVDLSTSLDGETERLLLDQEMFISLDGVNGVGFVKLLPDYSIDTDGSILPVTHPDGRMPRPAYLLQIYEGGKASMGVVDAGDIIEVGGVYYSFSQPVQYPGLRLKTQPTFVLPMLYTSFAVLLLGLFLCFFYVPAAAFVRDGKVYLYSAKDVQMLADDLNTTLK